MALRKSLGKSARLKCRHRGALRHPGRAPLGLICLSAGGGEAAWVEGLEVLAPENLLQLINHFKGTQVMGSPEPLMAEERPSTLDLRDIKGQETAKRALEITAAGGHNLLTLWSQGPLTP